MTLINKDVRATTKEAHDLLMRHKKHYLWNKEYSEWTKEDFENLLLGKNLFFKKRRKDILARTQKVEVIFNNGVKKEYASVKSVANKFLLSQSTVSNILAGRKTTNKFKSISKI